MERAIRKGKKGRGTYKLRIERPSNVRRETEKIPPQHPLTGIQNTEVRRNQVI